MDRKPPAVTCTNCDRTWMSASMAEGLRLLGMCPRCGGALEFAEGRIVKEPLAGASLDSAVSLAPHLVMGIPRREP